MNLPTSVIVSSEVMARQVGEEVVLLDLASGNYFGLDAVGARIWQLITDGSTPEQVVAALVREYAVEEDTARSDTSRLLAELAAQGLVELK